MKREIALYFERFLTCRMVKVEHQRPHRKLQPQELPMWKWEQITMDLISKLPKTAKDFDALWVIVDQLTKIAHFLAILESSSAEKLANVYVREIVAHHGVQVPIVSDRDVRLTSQLWQFHEELGMRLHFNIAYHL